MAKASPLHLCIVTGLSGAGKSTALRAFEDLNYFAVDGLPASLAPDMAAMMAKPAMRHYAGIAIGMDLREPNFLEEFNKALFELGGQAMSISLVFLEAANATLERRYAATRRPHPLEKHGLGLASAIAREREDLAPLKDLADFVLDSSAMSIHDLRRAIHGHYKKTGEKSQTMRVYVLSFGFKYGIPPDADYVFDLRFLANPYFVDSLRPFSGLDQEIVDYIFKFPEAEKFCEKTAALFNFILPLMAAEGRARVTIAMGCTGGRHRSVAIANRLGRLLRQAGNKVILEHRNIDDDQKPEKPKSPSG